jgi:hypothetical protein
MQRDVLRGSLKALGIQPSDYRVLKLLPLICVAWADGKMDLVKKDRIHSFASRHYDLSAGAMRVLNHWLSERPTREYVKEALHDIYFLSHSQDDIEIDLSELPALLSYAEGIARSTSEALDLARELHIDHGESWAKLLKELG